MSEHPPGPWWIVRDTTVDMWSPKGAIRIAGPAPPFAFGKTIAAIPPDSDGEAHARLISKAWLLPEMVEALRAIALSRTPVCAGDRHGTGSRTYCDCGGDMVRAVLQRYEEIP